MDGALTLSPKSLPRITSSLPEMDQGEFSKVAFDLQSLAEYPPEVRAFPTGDQAEQISWLSELMISRAEHELPELPAFPTLAIRILQIVDEPDPNMAKLVAAIREDPVVSGHVMRMANSAFYSRGVEITTLQNAAVRLGMRSIAGIAVAAASRAVLNDEEFQYRAAFASQWTHQWKRAMHSAHGARWLSVWLHRGEPDQAFLCGLLHDIGNVMALRIAGAMIQSGDMPPVQPVVIQGILDAAHVELGRLLALQWNLPGYVQHVCGEHHAQGVDAVKANDVLHVVRIASGFYDARTNPYPRPTIAEELFSSAQALGLEREPLMVIGAELKSLGTRADTAD
jgi:HD-like signal output (HDOD) protein